MAHQGTYATITYFLQCSVHGNICLKLPQMGPGVFVLLIQTLPTFWAERILILIIFFFLIFLDPKFPDFLVPDFQISRNLAWAQLGPSLGRAWAQLSLGPAWARLGPTLGPWVAPRVGRGALGWDLPLPSMIAGSALLLRRRLKTSCQYEQPQENV